MARITVEDCLEEVHNRFSLVHVTAARTKQLLEGSRPRVAPRKEKAIVVALREIAAHKVHELQVEKVADEVPDNDEE